MSREQLALQKGQLEVLKDALQKATQVYEKLKQENQQLKTENREIANELQSLRQAASEESDFDEVDIEESAAISADITGEQKKQTPCIGSDGMPPKKEQGMIANKVRITYMTFSSTLFFLFFIS